MRMLSVGIAMAILCGAVTANAADLPRGHEQAVWGMTVAQLKEAFEIARAELGDEFGYAEHLEEDPEVYFRMTPDHLRVEYYFYQGRLYKIFIIYDRILFHTRFYEELVGENEKTFGKPKETYPEEFFGLSILHTVWEDPTSILDIRKGAGFIYQVRTDKAAAEKKAMGLSKKKSI